ncbi:3'-5' exonuclease [Helicobacter cetorum]|uniref:3'-5' exonuclease n=1 Tax=Helicobacter cetorum TaxID=138563 RepID=UPI000CF14BE5|nr:3'-5' exonuclease [Helicobacter cetorum]
MLCVFDIETIPNIDLCKQAFSIEEENALKICELSFQKQKEKSGSEFLPLYLHEIISISAVIGDDYGKFIKVGNFGKDKENFVSEKELLEDFFHYFNSKKPRLVSFNGRGFDMPLLTLKALKYNLSLEAFYNQENKWENYRSRYSEQFHLDLMDSLSHYGSVRGLNLNGICAMTNIPGKFDMSGDLVHAIYYDTTLNEVEKKSTIDSYCQSDVLNTYWLFLKYEVLKGALSKEQYIEMLQDFLEKLPKNMSYSSVFMNALEKEISTELV